MVMREICRAVVQAETPTGGSEAIGIDLGLADLAVLSTGERITCTNSALDWVTATK